MFCVQCGRRLAEDEAHCPICGAPVQPVVQGAGECPECGASRGAEDLYCRQCGALLPLDLAALEHLESSGEAMQERITLPEWLRGEEPTGTEGELHLLTKAELPDWLREPVEPSAGEPAASTLGEVILPSVAPVWGQPSASETADARLFEPLVPFLLATRSLPNANGSASLPPTAAETPAGRRLWHLLALFAFALLLAVAVYIVLLNR